MLSEEGAPRKGLLLVAAAAILWSTSGLFAKAPIFDNWDTSQRVIQMAFWRAVFASLVIGLLVRRPRWSWKLLPMMACFVAMSWAFLRALVTIESSCAIWLQYTAPAFVLVGSLILFRERMQRRDYVMSAVCFAGLGVILFGEIGKASTAGLFYGVLSGVFYAGVILSLRGLRDFDSAWLILVNQLATVAALSPFLPGSGQLPSGIQWPCLAGFGILQLGTPYLLFAMGLRRLRSQEASLVALLEPVLVPVWVFLIWRDAADYEPPRVSTLVGGSMILLSLIARYSSDLLARPRTPAK
jgi:drug/metabolite transporter, DME family